jgi:hypothetical protein
MRSNSRKVSPCCLLSHLKHMRMTLPTPAAPTRKQRELELLDAQTRITPTMPQGAATWLASGIGIEEAQITLARDVGILSSNADDNQKLNVARLRESLQCLIDVFVAEAVTFLGEGFDGTEILNRPNPSNQENWFLLFLDLNGSKCIYSTIDATIASISLIASRDI